jgi:acetyl-CoA acyltransferase
MSKAGRKVVVVAGTRTPFCKAGGKLRSQNAVQLGAATARQTVLEAGVRPEEIDQIIFGIVTSPVNAPNVAREIGLAAGLPIEIPGYSVSQACISANRAVTNAADQIALGRADVILAGGVETISDVPIQYGKSVRDALFTASRARDFGSRLQAFRGVKPRDVLPVAPAIAEFSTGETMGQSAEKMAKAFSIAREDQDALAARSHARALAAWAEDRFAGRIAPVPVSKGKEIRMIEKDDHPREDSNLEKLARLKPVFDRKMGSVTAANASPLTDGASSILLASAGKARAEGWPILGSLHSYSYAAVDPFEHLLMGPVKAVAELVEESGIPLAELGVIEMHEAFAAQVLGNIHGLGSESYCREKLGRKSAVGEIDPEFINQWGGSISLGHPFGATGGRLIMMLLDQLAATDSRYGLISACAAGAMGSAMLFERAS